MAALQARSRTKGFMKPEDLRTLSALLDQAMALPAAGRASWLDCLQGDALRLAPTLRALLAKHASRETVDLVDRPPLFTAPAGSEPLCSEFRPGVSIGPYRLVRKVGEGGMGEVWLAERDDGRLKRSVALKLPFLGARRGVLVQRFARERDILASLTHPHIARLYDAGIAEDGQPYLALEYVEGQPITAYCNERALSVRARVELLQQVLQAVQYAHANLVIHRDLKPSNVLVTRDGQAMLLDFGIAKLLQDDAQQAEETELTRDGGRALTLQHAAPEQIRGAPISTATDVWALGVLLYELIAGERPFRDETRGQLEQAILNDEPPRPCAGITKPIGRGPAADLDTIVLKALKKGPAERYASVAGFSEDLDRWLGGEPVRAQPDSTWYRTRKFVSRHRTASVAASLATLAVLAASGVSLWQAGLAREQAAIAQTEARTSQAVQEFIAGVFRANSTEQNDPIRARQRSAEQLLDEGAARIGDSLRDAPAAQVRVLETLADMYADMSQPGKAAALNERRAALLEGLHGPSHPQRVMALADWASSLSQAGEDERGEAVATVAEPLLDRAARPDPEARAALDLALIGMRLRRGGGYDFERSERAVRLLRTLPPCRCLLVAMDAYAGALRAQGRAAESLAIVQEAMQRAPQVPDAGASMFAALAVSRARAEAALGNHAAAIAAFEEAIAQSDRHDGADSAKGVLRRLQMARYLIPLGRPADALPLLARARQAVEGWPADSPQRQDQWPEVLALQAGAWVRLGRPEAALDLVANTGADSPSADTRERPHLAMLRQFHSGEALAAIGRDSEAAALLQVAARLIAQHRLAGDALLRVEQAQTQLLMRRRDLDAAAALLGRISARPFPDQLATLWVTATQSELALARGDCPAAASQAAAALATAQTAQAPEPQARLRLLLGRALTCSGRAAEAVPTLRAAVADWSRIEDPAFGLNAAASRLALAAGLQALGAAPEARSWIQQAAAIVARHPQVDAALSAELLRLRPRLGGTS